MENFKDFENKSYVEAKQVEYNIRDYIQFLLKFTTKLLQIYLVLLSDIFVQIFKVFSPPRPKNISGQLALVTGT